jgi:3-phenylpropionate/trans-cinnamate dioxygenase ferredoxin subunit
MPKHLIAKLQEFPAGTRKLITIGERRIVVFNVDGRFFALSDRCPHEGGSLFKGKLTGLVQSQMPGEYSYSQLGEVIRCPWHSWEFDLRTGRSYCSPKRVRVKNYAVGVTSGEDIKDELVAETFAVEIEGQYVYVQL